MPLHNSLQVSAMHTVLKNPKLRKTVTDGIKAPIGSTRRTQAQKVVNSIYTLRLNHNQRQLPTDPFSGQGGAIGNDTNIDAPIGQSPTPNFMGTVDLPTVSLKPSPKRFDFHQRMNMRSPSYNGYAPVSDHIGGNAGMYGGRGGALDGNTSFWDSRLGIGLSSLGGALNTVASAPSEGLAYGIQHGIPAVGNLIGKVGETAAGLGALGVGTAQMAGSWLGGSPATPGASLASTSGGQMAKGIFSDLLGVNNNPTPAAPASQFSNLIKSSQTQAPSVAGASTTSPTVPPASQSGEISSPGDADYDQLPGQTSGTVIQNQGTTQGADQGTTGGTPSSSGTPSSTTDPLLTYLQQAVGQGIGANAFANKVYSDMSLLKDFYGPDVPVDQLPIGASLTDQISALHDKLNQEQGLNALSQSLMDAQAQGGNVLKDDAQAYIQGKDQYLNQIDQMLNNAQNSFYNDPMSSDPWYHNAMTQYMTYLTTLRGRTTQRYVDYVNSTVDAQNNNISQLQAEYTAKATDVTNLFNSESQVTVQQYNDTKQALVDMYNNLAQQDASNSTTGKAYTDALTSQANSAAAIVKAATDQSGLATTQITNNKYTSLNDALNDPTLIQANVPPPIIAQQYVQAQIAKQRAALASDPSYFTSLYSSTAAEITGIKTQLQSLVQQYQQAGNNPNAIDQTTGKPLAQELQDESQILNAYTPFDKLYTQALTDYIGGSPAYTPPAGSTATAQAAKPSKLVDIQNVLNDMSSAIANGKATTYEQWSNLMAGGGLFFGHGPGNKSKATYYKAIDPAIQRLLFAAAQKSVGQDWRTFSASDIADKVYAVTSSTGIAGASSPVDLSQFDTSTSNTAPTVNINLNTPTDTSTTPIPGT